jgi:hypothetical protein
MAIVSKGKLLPLGVMAITALGVGMIAATVRRRRRRHHE